MTERVARMCREVRAQLPDLVEGGLSRWRRRLVLAHLRRCGPCRREEERQRVVATGLEGLAARPAPADAPPEGLLQTLLEQADRPGVRGRAAVPVRGAVSGARPVLSATLLIAGAAAGSAAGYAAWRGVRAVRARVSRGR